MVAIFGPLLYPFDPLSAEGGRLESPGTRFLFGTDSNGRDVLSRTMAGSRLSLYVGFLSVGFGTIIGSTVGIVSAYYGGHIDTAIQRVVDAMLAFPGLIFVLVLMVVLGPGQNSVVIAIGIFMIPGTSRVARGAALSVMAEQYIEAIRALGGSAPRMIFRHVLPNVTAPIIIMASIGLGNAIVAEAGLSFLGLGVPPPTPSWGRALSTEGRGVLEFAPWVSLAPGIALSLSVLAFNLVGDSIRDVLDPRLRGSRNN